VNDLGNGNPKKRTFARGPFLKHKVRPDDDSSPLLLTNAAGQVVLDLSSKTTASYRRWYTRLARQQPLPARLGVMAALSGEGVTTTAVGLAAVMASDLNERFCVVDVNWWRPGLAVLAHIEAQAGLAQVLSGESALNDILCPTNLPNLWLLPCGDLPVDQRSRQVRSQLLVTFLEDLGSSYDHLVIDLPSLLSVGDAATLAKLSGSLCLLVRQGVTPLPLIRHALDEVAHLPVSGVVFNGDHIALPRWLVRLIPGD
jgi:Mrp family chromosome partitioning ATPase